MECVGPCTSLVWSIAKQLNLEGFPKQTRVSFARVHTVCNMQHVSSQQLEEHIADVVLTCENENFAEIAFNCDISSRAQEQPKKQLMCNMGHHKI